MVTLLLRPLLCLLLLIPSQALAARQQIPPHYNDHWNTDSQLLVAKKWDDLSDREKKRVKEAQDRYQKLPQDKKEKLRQKWEKMPEREKEKYRLEKKYR